MEGPKVKIVVFNRGEVPRHILGRNKEKSAVTRYLKSVNFTHTATPRGCNPSLQWDFIY